MITLTDPRGHVAVLQADHAEMAAVIGRAWGNARFGPVEPREVVVLAAAAHELGWAAWDAAPSVDPSTGLPFQPKDLDLDVHLPMQLDGPRALAERDPYAGLLALRKHAAKYERPSVAGRLRPKGRRIAAYHADVDRLAAELRAGLHASDEEVERNWRLVHAWDALVHDVMLGRSRTHRRVPAAAGSAVDVHTERQGSAITVAPWPFVTERVTAELPGRLLTGTFAGDEELRATLSGAPPVTLAYELVPG